MRKKISILSFIFLLCHTKIVSNEKLASAYCNLALLLQESNEIDESLSNYQKALQINPTHLPTLLGIGKMYLKIKNYDKSIVFFQKRLQIDANCHQTHFNLAKAWEQKNNLEKAKKHYKKAIEINATYVPAYQNLIKIVKKDEAIKICKQGIKTDKKNIELRKKLIELLIQEKKLNKALQHCNKLIDMQPLHLPFQIKKAQILTLQNKFNHAIHIFENILKIQPNNKNILYNIAHLHKKNGQYEKAIHLLKKIEASEPENTKIILAMAQSYLSLGYYKYGWQYINKYNRKKQSNIRLTNTEDIAGKIILIQGELYCNQMIQLIRYAKLVKDKGAKKIIVQSPNQLVELLKQCPFIDEVISSDKRESCPFHKLVQLSSLPHIFGTTLENVPCETPYIFPEKEKLAFWQQILQEDKKYKVGLYVTKKSNIAAEKLMEIAKIKNISIYFLSNITDTHYLKHVENNTIIHNFGKGFYQNSQDISQLSAILPHLDLVICCDSFVAHLAGALAIPACVILPKVTNWQWPSKIAHTPWYPTVKLFRQQENWDDLIKKVTIFCSNILEKREFDN